MQVELDRIIPSPDPVRTEWDERRMAELAESIRDHGVIVPIKVRPVGGKYEIVYGHRRVEASRRAGRRTIEATVVQDDALGAMTEALIENVVREEMNELDKGRAVLALARQGRTLRDIGKTLGYVDRSKPGQGDPTIPSRWAQLAQDEPMLREVVEEIRVATGVAPKLNGLSAKLYGATPADIRREPALRRAMARAILADGLTALEIRILGERLREVAALGDKLRMIARAVDVLDEAPPEPRRTAAKPAERANSAAPADQPPADRETHPELAPDAVGPPGAAPGQAESVAPAPPATDRLVAVPGGPGRSETSPLQTIRLAELSILTQARRLAESPEWAGERAGAAAALRKLAGECLAAASGLEERLEEPERLALRR